MVSSNMQVLKLWYPWMTIAELESLVAAAPSGNAPQDPLLAGDPWHADNLSAIQKEFASIDVSGDGSVDRWVRMSAHICSD